MTENQNVQINVAGILKESTGATRRYQVKHENYLEEGIKYNASGTIELLRTNRGILVRGAFQGTAGLACSRCLVILDQPITFEFEEEFVPTLNINAGTPLAIEEDDTSTFVIDARHILDLSEVMRQYVLLTVPMKPLCSTLCRGLCPRCGLSLNLGPCECPTTSGNLPESEIAKLKDLSRKLR